MNPGTVAGPSGRVNSAPPPRINIANPDRRMVVVPNIRRDSRGGSDFGDRGRKIPPSAEPYDAVDRSAPVRSNDMVQHLFRGSGATGAAEKQSRLIGKRGKMRKASGI